MFIFDVTVRKVSTVLVGTSRATFCLTDFIDMLPRLDSGFAPGLDLELESRFESGLDS